jgi:carboxypeptidase T
MSLLVCRVACSARLVCRAAYSARLIAASISIALSAQTLALAPQGDTAFTPIASQATPDQSAVPPDTRMEDLQSSLDQRGIEPSPRIMFTALGAYGPGPWTVRAGYQSVAQLNMLRRRAAPGRVYPEAKIVILEVSNTFEFDQLINEGFAVQIDTERTKVLNTPIVRAPNQTNGIGGFACYRTVEETYATAEALVAQKPQIAEWLDIGDSRLKQLGQGGYDIRALHLGNRSITGLKPVLMVQGAIHAREYATAESVTRFAEQLVQGYGSNADITWMLDYHDVYLVLIANPDGRKVAEVSSTRDQRKNRNPSFACAINDALTGVDLNRNYPFDFGGSGTSTTICDPVFRGPGALSEPESAALTTFERAIFPDQRAETSLVPPDQTTPVSLDATGVYLDVHSNGRGTWFPWGNTTAGSAPNATQLQTIARKFGALSGLPAARSSAFGAIGGATDDWSFGALGVVAMTMELGGNDFYPPCSTFESSIGPPAIASFFMAARVVRAPYRLPAGPDVLGLVAQTTVLGATLTASANDTRFNPATEPSQAIASVNLFNTPPWVSGASPLLSFLASDGNFNSAIEGITVDLPLAQIPDVPRSLFYVQASDAAGNVGPVSAVFLGPYQNGFE